jgi:hypothetical protein
MLTLEQFLKEGNRENADHDRSPKDLVGKALQALV